MKNYNEKQNEDWQEEIASDLNKLVNLMSIVKNDTDLTQFWLPLNNVISRVADFEDIQ